MNVLGRLEPVPCFANNGFCSPLKGLCHYFESIHSYEYYLMIFLKYDEIVFYGCGNYLFNINK